MGGGPGLCSRAGSSRFAPGAELADGGCAHGDNARNPGESGQKSATITPSRGGSRGRRSRLGGRDFIPYHAVVNPTQSGAPNKEQRDESRRLGL